MLGGSDRLGREKMTGRDDVTDWCFCNLALGWLARSLMDQQKHDEAIKIYEEKLEIEKHLPPGRETIIATGQL